MQAPAVQAAATAQQVAQQFTVFGVKLEGLLTIAAIVAGPILALWAQRVSERRRELKGRKLRVFRELMATRGTRLSGRHVEALNAIQVEFHAKSGQERVVFEKWKEYLDHLNKKVEPNELHAWGDQGDEIFATLLYEMSKAVGYDYDRVAIRRDFYSPKGHANVEAEMNLIRTGLVDILANHKALNIYASLFPNHPNIKVELVGESATPVVPLETAKK